MVGAALNWYRLPWNTRQEVIALGKIGRVHSDPQVAAIAFAWARRLPWLDYLAGGMLLVAYVCGAFARIQPLMQVAIGAAVLTGAITLIPKAWARRVRSASILATAKAEPVYAATTLRIRGRRLPPITLNGISRASLLLMWSIVALRDPTLSPWLGLLVGTSALIFVTGPVMAIWKRRRAMVVLDWKGVHAPSYGFSAPWSALEPANVDSDAEWVRWLVRDPTILAGLAEYDQRSVPFGKFERGVVAHIDSMRERPEDVLRTSWALARSSG